MRRNCLRRLTQRSEIASLVCFAIIFDLRFSVRTGRDHRFNATLDQVVSDFVAVVAFVAEEAVGINIVQLHQRVITFDLMRFTAGHVERQHPALRLPLPCRTWPTTSSLPPASACVRSSPSALASPFSPRQQWNPPPGTHASSAGAT